MKEMGVDGDGAGVDGEAPEVDREDLEGEEAETDSEDEEERETEEDKWLRENPAETFKLEEALDEDTDFVLDKLGNTVAVKKNKTVEAPAAAET